MTELVKTSRKAQRRFLLVYLNRLTSEWLQGDGGTLHQKFLARPKKKT